MPKVYIKSISSQRGSLWWDDMPALITQSSQNKSPSLARSYCYSSAQYSNLLFNNAHPSTNTAPPNWNWAIWYSSFQIMGYVSLFLALMPRLLEALVADIAIYCSYAPLISGMRGRYRHFLFPRTPIYETRGIYHHFWLLCPTKICDYSSYQLPFGPLSSLGQFFHLT